jgi:translation initiation factor IF-1
VGVDTAVTTVKATVMELLPSASFKVKLENEEIVTAHVASAVSRNFMRLRPGDRVEVKLSEKDRTRGRIVELVGKEGKA